MTAVPDRVALRPEQVTIPPGHPWNRLPIVGAVCAVLGAAVCAILGAADPKQFFFSWLVSFLFFLSLSLGALFFVEVARVVGIIDPFEFLQAVFAQHAVRAAMAQARPAGPPPMMTISWVDVGVSCGADVIGELNLL